MVFLMKRMIKTIFLSSSTDINMNKLLIVLFGLVAAANAVSFFDLVKEEWNAFKVRTMFPRIEY